MRDLVGVSWTNALFLLLLLACPLMWKVVVPATSTFMGIVFVLCVGYGVVAPSRFHSSWLLEAMLPGFKWLSIGAVLLGFAETMAYGAGAATLA